MVSLRGLASLVVVLSGASILAACTPLPRGPAVQAADVPRAFPLGIANARFYADGDPAPMIAEATLAIERIKAALRAEGRPSQPIPPSSFLAISGGADNGAFGAGLINGWTTTGTRPEFRMVTGISTGALIAPFAFLGPSYDGQLREVYTELGSDSIFSRRAFTAALFSDAMAGTRPLAETIDRYVDGKMLAAIGREYERGRLLMLGTTDLDAQRPVIWNIGAIAASGHPQALDLFRKILLATAAIPGAFPPVMIDVEVDGTRYQEMHVDGGVNAQLFLYPGSFDPGLLPVRSQQTAYLIRNARLDSEHAEVERRTISIAGRAIGTMLQSAGYSDVALAYFLTKRDDVAYRLAYIGADFTVRRGRPFEQAYMRALFDYGYTKARSGKPWHLVPPGLHTTRATRGSSPED
ncbi:patatin-like phospholipase family protein [Reyranella sp.]|uniref:patatin-like phospholipase family protein n=1 Tax=Reyranella sp. TaxID=1929291 RepID=UPI003D0E1C75